MFQKCPKCNGEGKVDSNRINEHLSIFTSGPIKVVYEKDPCPICLGECIIHSEQGVPPSKVKRILTIHTGPDGQPIEVSAKAFGASPNPESLNP